VLNIKRPAHSKITPSNIKWRSLTKEEVLLFKKHFNSDITETIQKKDDECSTHLSGYYRSTGRKKNFIKILNKTDSQFQLQAEQIASWLKKNGVIVSCTRGGYPKKIEGRELWIYAYDYIEYEFFTGSEKSLYFIGSELGKMHKLMQDHPFSAVAFNNGKKKNKILFQQLNSIKTKEDFSSLPKSAVELIKATSDKDFQVLFKLGQMVHGDMNFGNIIFKKNSHQPIFIDFEDSTTAWLSPLYDIAFIVQRFILLSDLQDKPQLASFFFTGYRSQNNLHDFVKVGDLHVMLRMISVRSLLILSTLSDIDRDLYSDEINKFISLHKEMIKKIEVISKIERLIFT
jgi:fructosamine-3-kinase